MLKTQKITIEIRGKMKEKNVNIITLAENIGYSYSYITKILRGERRWNEDIINKVFEYLD